MSFGSLVELYMEDCKHRLKPTTYSNKQFLIDTKLLPFFRDMPINTITPATIRKWQNELLADPKGYSPTYLKTVNNQELLCKGWFLPSNTYGITPSMSRKGNPYDNAMAENFFSILKTECIYRHKPADKVQ